VPLKPGDRIWIEYPPERGDDIVHDSGWPAGDRCRQRFWYQDERGLHPLAPDDVRRATVKPDELLIEVAGQRVWAKPDPEREAGMASGTVTTVDPC